MGNVTYNTCCCDCSKLNRTRSLIYLKGSAERYLEMTEYEFSPILSQWMEELEAYCHFCGSNNIYGEEIEINDNPLYNFHSIVEKQKASRQRENFLILNIYIDDGILKREIGGKNDNEENFLFECLVKMTEAINNIPQKRFVNNRDLAQFFIALTGTSNSVEIQCLKMCVFDKNFLMSEVVNFAVSIR